MDFIIFILSTTGITLILTRSKLLRPIRARITEKYVKQSNLRLLMNKLEYKGFWWWLNEIFNCYLCMTPYTGTLCAILIYLSQYYPIIIYSLYPFAAVPLASLMIQQWINMNKNQ